MWIFIMVILKTISPKTKIKSPDVTPRPNVKYSDEGKIGLLKQLCPQAGGLHWKNEQCHSKIFLPTSRRF